MKLFRIPMKRSTVSKHRKALQEVESVREKVAYLLERYPPSRNNDNYLACLYWKLVDSVSDFNEIEHATKYETIRRNRQLLNEKGLFLPTDIEVIKKRRQLAVQFKKLHSKKKGVGDHFDRNAKTS